MSPICFYHWHLVFFFHLSILSYLLSKVIFFSRFLHICFENQWLHLTSPLKFYPCLFIQVLKHENNAFQNFTRNLICLFDTFFTYDKLVSEIYQEKDSFYRYLQSFFNSKLYSIFELKKSYAENGELILFYTTWNWLIDFIFYFIHVIILQFFYYRPYFRRNTT